MSSDKPTHVVAGPGNPYWFTPGRTYAVMEWLNHKPLVRDDQGDLMYLARWAPAQPPGFKVGDMVQWAGHDRPVQCVVTHGTIDAITVRMPSGATLHGPTHQFSHVQQVSVSDTSDYREPPEVELTFGPLPESGTAAHGILTEAADIVKGARNATHGDKERSFAVIASLWNGYLDGRKIGGPITGRDVAACMVLLKLARSVQGTPHRDHFVDAAGYAAIAGELA